MRLRNSERIFVRYTLVPSGGRFCSCTCFSSARALERIKSVAVDQPSVSVNILEQGKREDARASEVEASASYTISAHFSLVLSPVLPSPLPNTIPSVLCVRGAPFRLSRRFDAAEEAEAVAGSGLEEEATGVGVGRVVALGFEAALGAGLESLEGSGLRVTGGEPGAGEGEGRADPVEGSQLREERSWREGEDRKSVV